MNDILQGITWKKMVLSGINNLTNHVIEINELNVFPVPDGDTGTNMKTTLAGGYLHLKNEDSLGSISSCISKGALLSARGNSGVILSQFFKGISIGFEGLEVGTVNDLYNAFSKGVEYAYNAVVKPKEGTILTCFRMPLEAIEGKAKTIDEFFELYIGELKRVIPLTTEMLDVLKEEGVVDSGGKGWLYIVEGMYAALLCKDIVSNDDLTHITKNEVTSLSTTTLLEDGVNYGYCTEFILQLAKRNESSFNLNKFISILETFGDSIVALRDELLVKVHIHTKEPGDVLKFAHSYGEFISMKIENMSLQNQEVEEHKKQVIKHKKNAYITISTGDGFEEIFKGLNADVCLNGGQTMNTSCQEIIDALSLISADNVFILPNNKNIILAANQAKELVSNTNIVVVETKSIVEGYFALSSLTDPNEGDVESIIEEMNSGIEVVTTGEITYSIRDTHINGVEIKENDYIGIYNNELLSSEKDLYSCLLDLLSKIEDVESRSIVLFVGQEVKEDVDDISNRLMDVYPYTEIGVIYGGQDVYQFLIGVI